LTHDRKFLLLRDQEVVGYVRPGEAVSLPNDLQTAWQAAGEDLARFEAALPAGYSLVEVETTSQPAEVVYTPEQAMERRFYYMFRNGDVVGVLDAVFVEGEFAYLMGEQELLEGLPESLRELWLQKGGDLGAFLSALEEDERRFNYMEALPEETEEELAAELQADREAIARHWERGLKARDRFLFVRALRELEMAAALCDKYAMVDLLAELCNEMGNIFVAFEDYDAAAEVLEEGLAYETSDVVSRARLLTNLSQALDLAGKRKRALEVVEAALADIPADIDDSLLAGLYSQAASLYNQDGAYEKAIQFYKLAAYLADNSTSVTDAEKAMFHNNLGMAYLEHREHGLALDQLRRAVALQPGDPLYQENLARCLDASSGA
jgi:tetratricopeptide (TPR) repeat protein